MENSLPFGVVYVMLIEDFLQFPPEKQKVSFVNETDAFQLQELFEIVQQSSDPEFAQILNRVRQGKHTEDDVVNIKKHAGTDLTQWAPNQIVKLYLTYEQMKII